VSVRVGAGLGFYGGAWRAVAASIERGGVRYIAADHLSELTLAILQKDRQRDPSAGYARDGLPMLMDLWPIAAKDGGDEKRLTSWIRQAAKLLGGGKS